MSSVQLSSMCACMLEVWRHHGVETAQCGTIVELRGGHDAAAHATCLHDTPEDPQACPLARGFWKVEPACFDPCGHLPHPAWCCATVACTWFLPLESDSCSLVFLVACRLTRLARAAFFHESREELQKMGAVVHEEVRPKGGREEGTGTSTQTPHKQQSGGAAGSGREREDAPPAAGGGI